VFFLSIKTINLHSEGTLLGVFQNVEVACRKVKSLFH